jgi:hypothetical protein
MVENTGNKNLWITAENMFLRVSLCTYSHRNQKSQDKGKGKELHIWLSPVKIQVKNQ